MNNSGEAADQVVRMYLNGIEVAAKLTGEASRQVAVLLYAALREETKTRGKARLTSMLRSGKELKVFAVRDADLEKFCKAAREYGVLYCVLKNKASRDGVTDIMVRAEDASKINRIFERFQLATVDRASLKSEIIRAREEAAKEAGAVPEQKAEQPRSPEDALIDSLLGEERERTENPPQGKAEKPQKQAENPSVPTSETANETKVPDRAMGERISVREEIEKIKASRQKSAPLPVPGMEQPMQTAPQLKIVKGKER